MPIHDSRVADAGGPIPGALSFTAVVVLGSLPAVLGSAIPHSAVELVVQPGFEATLTQSASLLLVRVLMPLVAVSSCLLFLGPGFVLSTAFVRSAGLEWHVLAGFALSYPLVSILGAVLGDVGGTAFGLSVLALTLACGALGFVRGRAAGPGGVQLTGLTPGRIAALLVVPCALASLLAPKFLWESFNSDGAHAFESARLLLVQAVPFWRPEAGEIAAFPGSNTFLFAYPVSWYIRLFGANEAGARLPLLLFVILLYAAVRGLSASGRVRGDAPHEGWLVWLGVLAFTWAMAFNATYEPYSADIALPATQDTLAAACFLAFVWAVVEARRGWGLAFGLMTCWVSPNGVLLLGLWLLARAAVVRPIPRRELGWTLGVIGLSMVAAAGMGVVLPALGQTAPGEEHGLVGLLGRFVFLQFTDLRRLAYVIVPCGILPALYSLAWRRQDEVSKALTLTAGAYFLFFYFQAYVSLHQFFPAMTIPIVVMWRTIEWSSPAARRWGPVAVLASGILALALQSPPRLAVDISGRIVGAAFEDRLPGYAQSTPESLRRAELAYGLFPVTWEPEVPEESFGGSTLIWNVYAHRSRPSAVQPNYVLQAADDLPPPGARLVGRDDSMGAELYVLSDSVWRAHLALRPPTPAGSRLMAVPRGILFRTETLEGGPHIIAVLDVLDAMGIDTDALLRRLGVDPPTEGS